VVTARRLCDDLHVTDRVVHKGELTWVHAAVGVAGLAMGVVAYRVQVDNILTTTPVRSMTSVAAGWAFLVAGLVAWTRRPGTRMGPLMVLAGFALLARQLRYSHDPLGFTSFFLLGELPYALFVHTVLAYPAGRLSDRVERSFVKATYTVALAFPLGILLTYDGSHRLGYFDQRPRESLLYVAGGEQLVRTLQETYALVGYGLVASVFIILIGRKLVLATPRARRILAPLFLAAVVAPLRAVFDGVLTFVSSPPAFVVDNLFWWQIAGITAVPIALLAGLLRARLARSTIGDLVVLLERTPPQGIRDALARALDDPSLEVAFWLPERSEFVDVEGRQVTLPPEGAGRAVLRLEHEGEPLAALVHDPSLLDEPRLVEAAGAAARLAFENARLHAEVRAQLAKVTESRARIVAAADEERRRIERDLHDGAQQRLVALALELKNAQRRLGQAVDTELDTLLASAADELQVAVQELRDLAHGIHPPVLTQGGLAVALDALATRAPLPVTVEAPLHRLAPDVEGAAYFVASEALANVAKHARASRARIKARQTNGALVIEVEDDGVGGAEAARGTGLRGLADRVEAQGGRLAIESPPGGGTRVVGEIPCES
jgi:signal transduction histidine kinase